MCSCPSSSSLLLLLSVGFGHRFGSFGFGGDACHDGLGIFFRSFLLLLLSLILGREYIM